ncbi:hypothetical protein SLEP1_g46542 [Rubroshorea leprosula]|uniref:Uncharacterized protein n=1 Tax=Rubroshorea leprosula TaxID=152421 RepID=A0AAV5LQ99_9ROSI|nr:hypothetical protein SLEP1_g46542 [Rubroshorea leprosula]
MELEMLEFPLPTKFEKLNNLKFCVLFGVIALFQVCRPTPPTSLFYYIFFYFLLQRDQLWHRNEIKPAATKSSQQL